MSADSATVTVRLIKSLEYKNFRTLIFHDINLHTASLNQLREMVMERIRSSPSLKQYENVKFDTFKLYYQAHGAKTSNPMINLGGDDTLVYHDYEKTLFDLGIRHEAEVSYFSIDDYEKYKLDPTLKW